MEALKQANANIARLQKSVEAMTAQLTALTSANIPKSAQPVKAVQQTPPAPKKKAEASQPWPTLAAPKKPATKAPEPVVPAPKKASCPATPLPPTSINPVNTTAGSAR